MLHIKIDTSATIQTRFHRGDQKRDAINVRQRNNEKNSKREMKKHYETEQKIGNYAKRE